MHRFEHGWIILLRIDVARGRDGNGAGDTRPQVRQDIAEQVGAHDHVEPIRAGDKPRRQNVDVELGGLDVRILGRDRLKTLIPIRHRMDDPVRLGRRRDALFLAPMMGEAVRA